jgi:hypothetical protein
MSIVQQTAASPITPAFIHQAAQACLPPPGIHQIV